MAKNVPKAAAPETTAIEPRDNVYEGTFKGSLEGNASTATALKEPMRVTFIGDTAGSFVTSGQNTTCDLTVSFASRAHEADHASTADTVGKATSADIAAHATYADHAVSADKAASADSAVYAASAGSAKNASFAQVAQSASTAESAKEAEHAAKADSATEAETAKLALALKADSDNPVPFAQHAEFAELAHIAQYDCLGKSIIHNYALKSELMPYKEMLTLKEAKCLFIPREQQILQAVVTGKAFGHGEIKGNTLELFIESVASCCGHGGGGGPCGGCGDLGGSDLYCDLIVGEFPSEPYADTTKAYIGDDGVMHVWDHNNQSWMIVRGELPDETKAEIEKNLEYGKQIIDQLEEIKDDIVTVHGAQTIEGPKFFHHLIHSPIPDVDKDPARVVAVLHNLRDIRDALTSALNDAVYQIHLNLDSIWAHVKAIEVGDFQIGVYDYTLAENQNKMVTGTVYLNFLDKEKHYIPVDDRGDPLDENAEIGYIRYIVRHSNGSVVWRDVKAYIDPNVWVPWDHRVDKTGKEHKDILLEQTAQLRSLDSKGHKKCLITLSANDTVQTGTQETGYNIRALNGKVTINGKEIVATNADLDLYLPLTGGELTGDLLLPNIPLSSNGKEVYNSHMTRELVDSKLREFNNNLALHKYMPKRGGEFTGPIQVPNVIDLSATRNTKEVLNATGTEQLFLTLCKELGLMRLEILDHYPTCNELKPHVMYLVPRHHFTPTSEIQSIRVEPDCFDCTPSDNEGIFHAQANVIA